jgi:hypothetical protein
MKLKPFVLTLFVVELMKVSSGGQRRDSLCRLCPLSASQQDDNRESLHIDSGNVTETQEADFCIIVCLKFCLADYCTVIYTLLLLEKLMKSLGSHGSSSLPLALHDGEGDDGFYTYFHVTLQIVFCGRFLCYFIDLYQCSGLQLSPLCVSVFVSLSVSLCSMDILLSWVSGGLRPCSPCVLKCSWICKLKYPICR